MKSYCTRIDDVLNGLEDPTPTNEEGMQILGAAGVCLSECLEACEIVKAVLKV